ncbi:cyclin-D1-binding protein 1, partial [Phenoliferia sp. Uapishka_3]
MSSAPVTKERDSSIISALQTTSTRCTSILSELSSPLPISDSSAPPSPAPLSDVRNDFIALSTFLGKESTALSLALKPPVSIAAVKGTVKNIDDLLVKLAFCLKVAPRKGPLAKELNWLAQETVEAVQRLLDGSLGAYQADGKTATESRKVNLRLTAQVWEKAEQAKQLSEDELQATRREWQNVLGLLDDCLEEVKEMEQSPSAEEDEEEDGEDDDDGDSDDFRSSHPLSDAERKRVAVAHKLLRIGRLLLQRLITSTASKLAEKVPGYSTVTFLETSQRLVKELSAAADDFAEELEPPQADVVELAKTFGNVAKELSTLMEEAVEGTEGKEAESKWLIMWRSQVDKLQTLEG